VTEISEATPDAKPATAAQDQRRRVNGPKGDEMANMTVSDLNQMERATLRDGGSGRVGQVGRRLLGIYLVIASALLAAMLVAAAQVFDGWHHVLVIGVGLITFYGLCRWVYPDRKHA